MKRRRGFSLADILMAMAFFSTLLVEESSGCNTMGSFDPSGKLLAFMSNRDGNPEI